MSTPVSSSPALPIAHAALRILIVVNWVGGAAFVVLLVALPTSWFQSALGVSPGADAGGLMVGLAIVLLGFPCVLLNYAVLKRLLAMVETVRTGDPFVAANAHRLRGIAWALLALQLLRVVGGAVEAVSTRRSPLYVDAGFSVTGWLAVLLTFVLARVFAQGALMRDDLEGTV